MGVYDCGDCIGRVMESVHELETQSESECQEKKNTAAEGYCLAPNCMTTWRSVFVPMPSLSQRSCSRTDLSGAPGLEVRRTPVAFRRARVEVYVVFASRDDAGRKLGRWLEDRGVKPDLILGLPRGGVVVAAAVAASSMSFTVSLG